MRGNSRRRTLECGRRNRTRGRRFAGADSLTSVAIAEPANKKITKILKI